VPGGGRAGSALPYPTRPPYSDRRGRHRGGRARAQVDSRNCAMWPQLLEQVPDAEACAFIHRCAHRLRALTLRRGDAGPQAPAPGMRTALAALRRAL